MKKAAIFALLVLSITISLPPVYGELVNGDFEQGLTGWTTEGSIYGLFGTETGGDADPDYELSITRKYIDGTAWVAQTCDVTTSTRISFNAKLAGENAWIYGTAWASVELSFLNESSVEVARLVWRSSQAGVPGNSASIRYYGVESTSWNEYDFIVGDKIAADLPSVDLSQIRKVVVKFLVAGTGLRGNASVFADDVTISPLPLPAPPLDFLKNFFVDVTGMADQYANGTKYIAGFKISASATEFIGSEAECEVWVDLADYLAITAEGQESDPWVTIWLTGDIVIGASYSLLSGSGMSLNMEVLQLDDFCRDPALGDGEIQSPFGDVYVKLKPFFTVAELNWNGYGSEFWFYDGQKVDIGTEISLEAGYTLQLLKFDIKKRLLDQYISQALSGCVTVGNNRVPMGAFGKSFAAAGFFTDLLLHPDDIRIGVAAGSDLGPNSTTNGIAGFTPVMGTEAYQAHFVDVVVQNVGLPANFRLSAVAMDGAGFYPHPLLDDVHNYENFPLGLFETKKCTWAINGDNSAWQAGVVQFVLFKQDLITKDWDVVDQKDYHLTMMQTNNTDATVQISCQKLSDTSYCLPITVGGDLTFGYGAHLRIEGGTITGVSATNGLSVAFYDTDGYPVALTNSPAICEFYHSSAGGPDSLGIDVAPQVNVSWNSGAPSQTIKYRAWAYDANSPSRDYTGSSGLPRIARDPYNPVSAPDYSKHDFDPSVRFMDYLSYSSSLADILGQPELRVTTSGNQSWFGQITTTHDGVDAAKSGAIIDSQTSVMQTTVTGSGTVSFWWKVSSEGNYDYLTFYIDDAAQNGAISGEVDWQQMNYTLTSGKHTLKWTYSKDYSVSSGADCGWVDQLTLFLTSTLTVNNGSGSGTYTNGQQVTISADTPATGTAFAQWVGDTQVVDNVNYTNALVTMSTNVVTLTATYTNLPGWYTLTVNNGSGSGTYTNGQQVTISANAPAVAMVFDQWTGDTQYVDNDFSLTTTVTMPAQDISLRATYVGIDFTYTTNPDNTITITGYTGSDGDVTIPGTIGGLPVTSIGTNAFRNCTSLIDITIPNSVISLETWAFAWCTNLTSIMIGNGVTTIATSFQHCYSLLGFYFQGNAPSNTSTFVQCTNATVYRLATATGWPPVPQKWAGRPTALWDPQDSNGNGIPDSWELQYFGGTTNANPNAICSNGFNTVREAYLAGLNPNDKDARFGITEHKPSQNMVRWGAVSGRVYNVYWTTNLLSGFQCLESNIPWTRGSFTNPADVPCGYYKIDVRLEN